MFHFQHPGYLLALAALPVLGILYLWLLQWKKKAIQKIGDKHLVEQLITGYSPWRFFIKFLLVCIAYAAGIVALANPRLPGGRTEEKRNGIDVMIALDVSRSMLAQDIQPSRLERAKQCVSRLIDKLPGGDRTGLVLFAGRAYLQMPLTGDNAAAKMFLSSASPDAVPVQGTVISDALQLCHAAFNSTEKKYKAVVLISDGEDHDEGALKMAKAMADEGIVIHAIGAGSANGAVITDVGTGDVKKDAQGNTVLTKLNEAVLKSIAVTGNGTYQLLTNADETAAAIQGQLQQMERRSIASGSPLLYKSFYRWFVALALLLLVVELFVSERVMAVAEKTILHRLKQPALLLVLLLCSNGLVAQSSNQLTVKGNKAYKDGDYATAAEQYKLAAEKDTASRQAFYNLGNALYKSGKADEALNAYDAALAKDTAVLDKAATWYNKGVVLHNNKKLPECIEAYKNALRLNPNDEEARLNLQKALQQQQQKQQQQQNKNNQQQQQKQNKQPQPQPSKMSRKEAEEKLKALLQHEKNLQDRLRKMDANAPQRPEKDW
jgi:tetratricopeptide (TPR) repeat protein